MSHEEYTLENDPEDASYELPKKTGPFKALALQCM